MNYLLIGGAALIGLLIVVQLLRRTNVRQLLRALRWILGGGAALVAALFLMRGRIDIASVVGAGAFSILRFGRLGPLVFGGGSVSDDNESAVTSRFISMNLDHGSGDVSGHVIAGAFKGADLIDLGPDDTRALLAEVAGDPDSLALLETWLDKNRAGWRGYFAEQDSAGQGSSGAQADPVAEAWEVLGLQPGASAAEVREAHRKLMKRVHPDQGGSTYLASKINEAKDRLLKILEP